METYGFLIVNSRTALGALPVPGASIKVTGGGNTYTFVTNESGSSPRIELPAPSRTYSLSPNQGVTPYSSYDVTVSASDYYPVEVKSIPIFDGIVSVQDVNMIPLAGYGFDTPPESALLYEAGVPFGLEAADESERAGNS
ncbi:MAG: carboxypeptidase regulatory-like domain-containing protein [Clostridiales bacterium]|nr:carboxypeptidase regulatory-like domain-containing protein [Clostridiales bacterium]